MNRSEAVRLYRRLLPYAKPHLHRLALLLLVSFLMVGLGLAQPWPMKVLVDNVIGGRPFPGEIYRAGGNTTNTGYREYRNCSVFDTDDSSAMSASASCEGLFNEPAELPANPSGLRR